MSFDIWISLAVLVPALVLVIRATVFKSRYSGIEDAVLFIRRLSVHELEQIMDPAAEWSLRRSSGSREFRRLQRRRMRLGAEYLARMAHNAEVVQGWSYSDHLVAVATRRNPADEKAYLLWELSKTATEVRISAQITRIEIAAWLLFRMYQLPLPLIPKLGAIRTAVGLDLLIEYQKMIDLARRVSQFYGPDWEERLNSAL